MKSIKSYIICIEQNKSQKKVYKNIINLMKIYCKMDAIFMNSKNS